MISQKLGTFAKLCADWKGLREVGGAPMRPEMLGMHGVTEGWYTIVFS